MIESLVYNIPVSMVETYRGRNVIVRSHDPAEIVEGLAMEDLERVAYVQILTLSAELHRLMPWGPAIPLDLVVQHPEDDLPLLYQCSPLLAKHPVRISLPVVPGFSKVVKLAVSLNFAVKLEGSQPDEALIEEMSRLVHAYLHQATVCQPIEYFHSLFLAFYREEPLTLWAIQEEDTSRIRYITDEGEETLSGRFVGVAPKGDLTSFVKEFKDELVAERGECSICEFLENCSGYFKWPREEYRCDGVKAIFQTLKDAAEQLRVALASFHSRGGEEPL